MCAVVLPHTGKLIWTEGLIQSCVASQLEMGETPEACNRY